MATAVIQASFNTGEWAPALNARVDIQKYHSAAALLKNWFVDYRGGASTRAGTKYILQAYKSATAVRLIPFQASFTVGYILEFGDFYIRFINNGAYVLEPATTITGATQANPCVVHDVAHGYSTNDWVLISGVVGMTQLNGNYYQITVTDADHYSLADLNDTAINSSAFTAYVSGGTAWRVYAIGSPYAAADLAKVKFAQNVTQMVLCHPSYSPYILSLVTATNWTMLPIVIGATVTSPTGVTVGTTLSAGSVNYSYVVTAVDANGQESAPSSPASLASKQDLRSTAGTNTVSWTAVNGALSYNVYESVPSYAGAIAAGSSYGYIGNTAAVSFADSNIGPDFSITPPIPQNPFLGAGVATITLTANDIYTTVPTLSLTAAPSGGQTATAAVTLGGMDIYGKGDTIQAAYKDLYGQIESSKHLFTAYANL